MQARDPKGYYAQLGVAHTASAAEIKQAFRRLALHVHPDRNPSTAAEETFKQLIQAHAVLSSPTKRAEYDAQCVDIPQPVAGWGKQSKVLTPIVCVVCGRIPIQPKYVIFYEVKSLFVTTRRTPIQGIYCQKCADKRLLRATLVTWLLGWWGLPWGPFYTLHALVHNLLGGRKPNDTNARILGYQARYFASVGRMFLARSLALMALELSTDHGLRASLQPLLPPSGEQRDRRSKSRLKHGWGWRGSAFIVQSVLLLCMSSAGTFLFAGGNPMPQRLRETLFQDRESAPSPSPAVSEIPPVIPLVHYPEMESYPNRDPQPLQEPSSSLTPTWYTTVNSLKLRAGPGFAHTVFRVLERFETVTVMEKLSQGEWVFVQTMHGTVGFVLRQYVTRGNGSAAKRQWCQEQQAMLLQSTAPPVQKKKEGTLQLCQNYRK
jgi:hypothetical protein